MFGTTGGKAASHDTRSVTGQCRAARFHRHRTAGDHHHHRLPDGVAAPGRPRRPGNVQTQPVPPATCGRSDWLPSIFIPHSPAFRPAARATPPRRPRGDSLFLLFPSSTRISFSRNSTLRCRSPTPPTPFCPWPPFHFFSSPSDLNLLDESSDYSGFASWSRNNYRGNGGNDTGALDANGNETNNGIFRTNRRVSIDQISDGVGVTALFSEGVTGDGDNGVISTPGDWFVVSPPTNSRTDLYTALQSVTPGTGSNNQVSCAGRQLHLRQLFRFPLQSLDAAQRPQRRHRRWE